MNYIGKDGSFCYIRDGYNMQMDTENPNHLQHVLEFRQMAIEIADVTTALDVSINDMGEIFAGEKTTKFVSQQIAKQLQARLSNFKIKF